MGDTAVIRDVVELNAVYQLKELGECVDKEAIKSSILSDKPDLLLYPEIGMNPNSAWLASQRLASVQVASWGHPVTSGFSTIDYYLSGSLLESAVSKDHYSEKLVTLPGTGCVTEFTQVAEDYNRLDDSLSNGPTFILPHTPFKFHPENDDIFIEIAKYCPSAIFLIPDSAKYPKSVTKILARISKKFTHSGLEFKDRFLVFPWLSNGEFLGLLKKVDVYLDLPTFSGYTTAWKAINCGLPVVTLEGEFMRQRLAAGLLRQAQMPDTIASSRQEYVEIAVRLAGQSKHKIKYEQYRNRIKSKSSLADNNILVIKAFENFVLEAVRKEST